MALRIEMPASSFSATLIAVQGIALALSLTGPHLRNIRDAQKAWNAAGISSRRAHEMLDGLQKAVVVVNEAVQSVDEIKVAANPALEVRRLRGQVLGFADHLEKTMASVTKAVADVRALQKYRHMIPKREEFDSAIASMDDALKEMPKVAEVAQTIRGPEFVGLLDEMLARATKEQAALMLARARMLARPATAPNGEKAERALVDLHDFFVSQGIKPAE